MKARMTPFAVLISVLLVGCGAGKSATSVQYVAATDIAPNIGELENSGNLVLPVATTYSTPNTNTVRWQVLRPKPSATTLLIYWQGPGDKKCGRVSAVYVSSSKSSVKIALVPSRVSASGSCESTVMNFVTTVNLGAPLGTRSLLEPAVNEY